MNLLKRRGSVTLFRRHIVLRTYEKGHGAYVIFGKLPVEFRSFSLKNLSVKLCKRIASNAHARVHVRSASSFGDCLHN